MTFSEKLRKERQRLNLTQSELAPLLDVSPSWVFKAESDLRAVHVLMQEGALARLAKLKSKTRDK